MGGASQRKADRPFHRRRGLSRTGAPSGNPHAANSFCRTARHGTFCRVLKGTPMDFHIADPEVFHYPDHADGITLTVQLSAGGHSVEAIAKVDSGAGVCLFSREIGAHLGLVVEQGIYLILRPLSGPIEAFGHEVRLETGTLTLDSFVYFAKYP